jgi:hypothetical protein
MPILPAKVPTIKQMREFLQYKLSTSKKWTLRALEIVFGNQTIAEQGERVADPDIEDFYYDDDELTDSGKSIHKNGVGFTKVDAEILTSLWKHYKSKEFLSDKQYAILFQKMPKYHRQVLRASDQKGEREKLDKLCKMYFNVES